MVGIREELKKMAIIVRYEILKHLRRKRIYIAITIFMLTGLACILVPACFNAPMPPDAKTFGANYVNFLGMLELMTIICGTFFVGDAIASEFEHKTAFISFINPVKRETIVLGKYIAAFIPVALAVSLYYLVGAVAMYTSYNEISMKFVMSYLLELLYLASVTAFTMLFSSLFKRGILASVLSFILLFLVFPIISFILVLAGVYPIAILTFAGQIVTEIFMDYPMVEEIPAGHFTFRIYHPMLMDSIMSMLAYVVVSLVISTIIVKFKEV